MKMNFTNGKNYKKTFDESYHATTYCKGNSPMAIGLNVRGIIVMKTNKGMAFTLACDNGKENIGVNIPSWLGRRISEAVQNDERDFAEFFKGMTISACEPFDTPNGETYNLEFDVAE